MTKLTDYFERVAIINRPDRPERKQNILNELKKIGLTENDVTFTKTFTPDNVVVPDYWVATPGAYCCFKSHLHALEQAQRDNVSNILLLEDDAIFCDSFNEGLKYVIRDNCLHRTDYDILYLGGQHIKQELGVPIPYSKGLVEAFNVNRTHAYAVSNRMYEPLIQYLRNKRNWCQKPKEAHIDYALGELTMSGFYKVYAACPFLVGQREGTSDVSAQEVDEHWWNPGHQGFINLPFPEAPQLKIKYVWSANGFSGIYPAYKNGKIVSYRFNLQAPFVVQISSAYHDRLHYYDIEVKTEDRTNATNFLSIDDANNAFYDKSFLRLPPGVSGYKKLVAPLGNLFIAKCQGGNIGGNVFFEISNIRENLSK